MVRTAEEKGEEKVEMDGLSEARSLALHLEGSGWVMESPKKSVIWESGARSLEGGDGSAA